MFWNQVANRSLVLQPIYAYSPLFLIKHSLNQGHASNSILSCHGDLLDNKRHAFLGPLTNMGTLRNLLLRLQ